MEPKLTEKEQREVEQKLTEIDFQKQVEANNLNVGIVVRTECVNIISNVLNAWLNVKQTTKNPLSKEEISAIQNQINTENNITKDMFNKLEAILNPNKIQKEKVETNSKDLNEKDSLKSTE